METNMRINRIISLLLIAAMAVPATAQKRKPAVKKKKVVPVVEVVEEDPKFEEMLGATQQIVIIDSVVVDKQQFLDFYKLTAEAGTVTGYNQFFKSDAQPYSTVYVNEMGNKCWFSENGRLFTADMLGSQWSDPIALEGLGRFQRTNYPFMLADGVTLYFAAISSDGLGGLDVYVSRYDSDSGKFLLAENLGLPFNSDANDYMYAVDEYTNIGYFATDRRQPEGKVCIYTFIPNQKRLTYAADDYDDDTIRSRARIDRIADTWGDGNARNEALARLQASNKPVTTKKEKREFSFYIDDNTTYSSLTDFRDADNRDRISELNQMRKRYESLGTEMEKVRKYYATMASGAEKNALKQEILDGEKEYYQLERNIRQIEKLIRNAEIKAQQ